ncbi:histone-fold-containing protein [Pseudomassariella vexata]|uniref:DNA polymerase epsilon subunit D n=1 Tax=Pseudomassariella vexata TaxID=1141098 RepID=A0A1Y2DS27_9PEZI|nr:histone-fold-containing protein [Pseudomassariella vexata]ORY62080.1 histone-fold-containing protein [Pseudomassariella vexata]
MPRKSAASNSRRSDVSMAQFVLAEAGNIGGSPVQAATPATAPPPSITASSTTAIAKDSEMQTDRPGGSVPSSERERKDSGSKEGRDSVAIEDLNLPKSIITRLAKGVLPPNTQIQANAILAMSKSATVFVNYLANAANEITTNSGKKTIMPNDVFDALKDVEFEEFRDSLQAEFKKFNEIQTTKRNTYRRRVAAAKKGLPYPPDGDTSTLSAAATDGGAGVGDTSTLSSAGPRSAKKQKPNNPGDDSAMDIDGDATGEIDAESEPEQEQDEDDEDEEAAEDEEEEQEEDEEDEQEGGETQDALEEREDEEERDEALDSDED